MRNKKKLDSSYLPRKQIKLWNRLSREAVRDAFLEAFSWLCSSVTCDTGRADSNSYLRIEGKHLRWVEQPSFPWQHSNRYAHPLTQKRKKKKGKIHNVAQGNYSEYCEPQSALKGWDSCDRHQTFLTLES